MKASKKDIFTILQDWTYEPGKVTVRKVLGDDGHEKIQMRLDLGVMQMEPDGRPDGRRPHGCDSIYHHCIKQLTNYRRRHGTVVGFELDADDCKQLRDESLQNYHRYLAMFVLEDYESVIRDAARNLEIFDLCRRFASTYNDRMALEMYRPYALMMFYRSKAQMAQKAGDYITAIEHVRTALRGIQGFFEDLEDPEAYDVSPEVRVLKQLGRRLRKKMPTKLDRRLRRKLQRALRSCDTDEVTRITHKLELLQRRRRLRKERDEQAD